MSRKVLVVDDEKLIVKGIRFSLEQDGSHSECHFFIFSLYFNPNSSDNLRDMYSS